MLKGVERWNLPHVAIPMKVACPNKSIQTLTEEDLCKNTHAHAPYSFTVPGIGAVD